MEVVELSKILLFSRRRRLFALDIIAVCSEAFQESSPTSLTLFPERTVSTPAPPEPTHITAGGDWFLGMKRFIFKHTHIEVAGLASEGSTGYY